MQNFHCDDAEALALDIHLFGLLLVRAVDFESRHALQVFKEAVTEVGVNVPVFGKQALRDLLDHHDDARNEGNAHKEHETGLPAHVKKDNEQGERGNQAVEELGEKFAEISLQLLNTLTRQLHDLRCWDLFTVGRAEPKKLRINLVAQDALDVDAGFK